METIKSNELIPVAMTSGRSMTFMSSKRTEMFYASRRVANDILNAQFSGNVIDVYIQVPLKNLDEEVKPWQRLKWLATPSRF